MLGELRLPVRAEPLPEFSARCLLPPSITHDAPTPPTFFVTGSVLHDQLVHSPMFYVEEQPQCHGIIGAEVPYPFAIAFSYSKGSTFL